MRSWIPIAATLPMLALPMASLSPATSSGPLPTCFGRTVTILGTDGDDRLVGEADVSDVIFAGKGNDSIFGGDYYANPPFANDYICGGPGNDWIHGSPGDDYVRGGWGDDRVNGDNGADHEYGDAGADRVGQGSFAEADSSNDVIRGGNGPDDLIGGWGRDRLLGGSGNDELGDNECDPTIMRGGPGADYLESWTSSYDGYGWMTCADYSPDNPEWVADTVDGGDGTDSSKNDTVDHITNVESTEIVLHGQSGG